jgi:hypothetical protein
LAQLPTTVGVEFQLAGFALDLIQRREVSQPFFGDIAARRESNGADARILADQAVIAQ